LFNFFFIENTQDMQRLERKYYKLQCLDSKANNKSSSENTILQLHYQKNNTIRTYTGQTIFNSTIFSATPPQNLQAGK